MIIVITGIIIVISYINGFVTISLNLAEKYFIHFWSE